MEEFYELDDGDHQSCRYMKSQLSEKHDGSSSGDSISDEETMESLKPMASSTSHNIRTSSSVYTGSKHQDVESKWSTALKDVKELARLQAKPHVPTYASHLLDGKKRSRGSGKPKFSIRSHLKAEVDKYKMLHKETNDDLEGENVFHHISVETPLATLPGGFPPKDNEVLPLKFLNQDLGSAASYSVAKLLEDLQEKDFPTYGNLKLDAKSGKKHNECFGTRRTTHLGTRTLDDEDPLEFAGDGMSSEDEDYRPNQLSIIAVKNNQTMAGIFQEAFNTSSCFTTEAPAFTTSRQTATGYYARLQRIIQNEKDTNLNFSKPLHTGKSPSSKPDSLKCLTVRILSRYLEAKLTVCHCLLIEDLEKNTNQKCPLDCDIRKRTVIFSSTSRMSCDVELEVDNVICIHPPWKEVLIGNGENVILSSYFTRVIAD